MRPPLLTPPPVLHPELAETRRAFPIAFFAFFSPIGPSEPSHLPHQRPESENSVPTPFFFRLDTPAPLFDQAISGPRRKRSRVPRSEIHRGQSIFGFPLFFSIASHIPLFRLSSWPGISLFADFTLFQPISHGHCRRDFASLAMQFVFLFFLKPPSPPLFFPFAASIRVSGSLL